MEPWMNVSLLPPPVQTTTLNEDIDVLALKHTCDNIIRVLSKQLPLHREGALLSRFVYKYDKKFRNDIGYRNLRKTYLVLRKYKMINLLKDIENFTTVLPDQDDDCMPTRQMLEYVLSRIMSFSKMMLRMYVCSKQGAVFYLDRIKRGQNHWMSLMPYALLCRVWSGCNILLHHALSWYSNLHPYLELLKLKGLPFLPKNYELPKDVSEWLDLKNLDNFGKMNWATKATINVSFDLADDTDLFDNILEYASNINTEIMETEDNLIEEQLKITKSSSSRQFQTSKIVKIDLGQVISRDSFRALNALPEKDNQNTQVPNIDEEKPKLDSSKILSNFQKRISSDNKCHHYFGKISDAKSLKDFLDKEESFRNDGNNKSLTKHLSFMQWHSLKTSLLKVSDSVLNNKKIERKLSKVWKEKCLNYM